MESGSQSQSVYLAQKTQRNQGKAEVFEQKPPKTKPKKTQGILASRVNLDEDYLKRG